MASMARQVERELSDQWLLTISASCTPPRALYRGPWLLQELLSSLNYT